MSARRHQALPLPASQRQQQGNPPPQQLPPPPPPPPPAPRAEDTLVTSLAPHSMLSIEDRLRVAVRELSTMRAEFQRTRVEKDDEVRRLESAVELSNIRVAALTDRVQTLEELLLQWLNTNGTPTPAPSSAAAAHGAPPALPPAAVAAPRQATTGQWLPPLPDAAALARINDFAATRAVLAQWIGKKHPCVRVFGRCAVGDKCAFAPYPAVVCLRGLKGQCDHSPCNEPHVEQLPGAA